MISRINGTIISCVPPKIILSVPPFECSLTVPRSAQIQDNTVGATLSLFVHMVWSSEHGPSFLGFIEESDKIIFELLTECSGVGAKLAGTIMDALDNRTLYESITQGNNTFLKKVSGCGEKKSDIIIGTLKNRIKKHESLFLTPSTATTSPGTIIVEQELQEALLSLGYTPFQIRKTIAQLKEQEGLDQNSLPHLIRDALSLIGNR